MSINLIQLVQRLKLGHTVPVLALLMEVLWAYAWLAWLSSWNVIGWPSPPITLASAVVFSMAVQLLTRFAIAREWPLRQVRLVVLPVSAILLALLVRLEADGGYALWDTQWAGYASEHIPFLLVGLAFGVYLLWRGISVGRGSPSFDDVYRRFLTGLVALVVLLILWGGTSGSGEFRTVLASAGIYVLAYFSLGLVALALANLTAIREEMLRHDETSALLSRRWVTLVLVVILTILALAIAAASVFSLDLLVFLLHAANILAGWLLIAFVYGVGYPLGILAAALIYVGRFFVRMFGGDQSSEPFNLPDFSDLQKLSEGNEAKGIPPEALLALKWGLVALVVLLVSFLLARSLFRHWKGKPEKEIEEISESMWSWSEVRGDLLSLLFGLLRWLRRRKGREPESISAPAAAMPKEDDGRLFTVRELYQGLLWEGRQVGLPRRQAATPYEYKGLLEGRLGADVPELEALTTAYVSERYGPGPTETHQLVLLNRLWRRLRSLLRGEPSGGG